MRATTTFNCAVSVRSSLLSNDPQQISRGCIVLTAASLIIDRIIKILAQLYRVTQPPIRVHFDGRRSGTLVVGL